MLKLTMTSGLSDLYPAFLIQFPNHLAHLHIPQRMCKLQPRPNLYRVIQSQFVTGHASNTPVVTGCFRQHNHYVHRFNTNLRLATFIQEGVELLLRRNRAPLKQ